MERSGILSKKKMLLVMAIFEACVFLLIIRVFYIQFVTGETLQQKAYEQQTRDRVISPNRGSILDRNMVGIAKTETVASISVIHNQIKDKETVATVLSQKLDLDYNEVFEKVNKRVALQRIKMKVDKEVADEIRAMNLPGVVVDEGIKRIYVYDTLASHVIGFVGKDNQGIIGLEAKYDEFLKGESGKILTETDVRGREAKGGQEYRVEPKPGYNLVTSIDVVLQQYAEQTIEKIVEIKNAKRGAIILMNPQNGEIYAMANKPDFNLNDPFEINVPELKMAWEHFTTEEKNNYLNQMWRNFSINDTYEPGSTFKVFTSAAGLEEKVVAPQSPFSCNGFHVVAGRQIKCWRFPRAHGGQTFTEGVYNSCNPVFMLVAEALGAETFYKYLDAFGFDEKTGIDLPGEAVGIMHKLDKVGPVELATMSFGQSFQITPIQLLRAGSSVINGGKLITPHFATKLIDENGKIVHEFEFEQGNQVISPETSKVMSEILEGVVYAGTGNKTYIPGYKIGGKTATSEKLPRRSGKYIASFMAFAPADDPKVIGLVLIDEPKGTYYGGQVAGPVMKELLENTLPYLNIKPVYTEAEQNLDIVKAIILPSFVDKTVAEAKSEIESLELVCSIKGEGTKVINQFPLEGDEINKGATVILYVGE